MRLHVIAGCRLFKFLILRGWRSDEWLIGYFSMPAHSLQVALAQNEISSTHLLLRRLTRWLHVKNPCFAVSLVLFSLIDKNTKLIFGAQQIDAIIEGHAWVEHQQITFSTEHNITKYAPLRVFEK